MKKLLKIFSVVVLVTTILSSCDNDPDNLYGKNKPMRILDENGNITTKVYASIVSGTIIRIVGGVGIYHTIEVEDESLIDINYSHRGAEGNVLYMETTVPALIIIKPTKLFSAFRAFGTAHNEVFTSKTTKGNNIYKTTHTKSYNENI